MVDEIEIDDGSDSRRDARIHQIAARRYAAECAGVVVGGQRYHSDRESQGRVTGAVIAAQQALAAGAPFEIQWKTRTGWALLDAEGTIEMATAVLAHVQACFAREAALLAELDAGTYADTMLGAGWP